MHSQIFHLRKNRRKQLDSYSSLSNYYTPQISHHFITDGLKLEHEVILKIHICEEQDPLSCKGMIKPIDITLVCKVWIMSLKKRKCLMMVQQRYASNRPVSQMQIQSIIKRAGWHSNWEMNVICSSIFLSLGV